MHQRTSYSAWRRGAIAVAALALAVPGALAAQGPAPQSRTGLVMENPENAAAGSARVSSRGFNLFGNADFGVAGHRMTGNHIWSTSNLGPCAEVNVSNCGVWLAQPRNGFWFGWFTIDWVAGSTPNTFNRIAAVHPGVSSAIGTGGGYTYMRTSALLGRSPEWGPKDGTLGSLFSGVATTSDGSCRDHSANYNGSVSAGATMLAVSDCPETWGPVGFPGPKQISDSAFIRLYQSDPMNFSFDWWRVDPADTVGAPLLGDYAAIGATNDYYAEALAAYGSVTPLGTGTPIWNGYPLGLDLEFQTFNFQSPKLGHVVFQQVLVINRSAAVYGTGINYDSLYMGVQPNPYYQNAAAWYFDPRRGAVMYNYPGTNTACNGAVRPSGVSACLTGVVRGFYDGASGIAILKSPIGDLRNKLFTRLGSPYYDPSHPNADDTLTFNHGRICGFGADCEQTTQLVNDKRGWGTLASHEAATLDGRDPATFPTSQTWFTFRNQAFNGVSNASVARYNRFVPAGWDYDDNGVQDTLFLDTCGSAGCVTPWADTMPGKQVNRYGNVGGHMAAGPFSLAAGDTTAFIYAFIGAADSVTFESQLNEAVLGYLNFFVNPTVAPPPAIVAATVTAASVNAPTGDEPEVRLTFTDAPETWVDPFLTALAGAIESDVAFARLDSLNPNLADSVRARAADNFDALWIFKSCDGGVTWTADADCDGDVAEDPEGNDIGNGWQPYFIIRPDSLGNIANNFIDSNVEGGRTYLYSLVTRTKGFRVSLVDRGPGGVIIARDTVFADSLMSPLQTTGPTTATVYVPISLAAGATPSTFTVSTVSGPSTLPVTPTLLQNVEAGTYRVVFGNRFIVRVETDTITGTVTSRVVVQDTLGNALDRTGGGAGTAVTNVVIDKDSLFGPGRVVFGGADFDPTLSVEGTLRVETDTIRGFGYAFARGDQPFFVSLRVNGSQVTPEAFQGRPDFPGLLITFNQLSADSLTSERVIQANGDTVNQTIADNNAVNLQTDANETVRGQARGIYEFRFRDDAYGPQAPFQLTTAAELQAAVTASLQARAVATTASTDTAIARRVYTAIPAWNNKPLVAVKFPFTVVAPNGNPTILAMVQRDSQPGGDNRLSFGTGGDTATVTVPTDLWVPSDKFVVLEVRTVDSLTAAGVPVIRDGARVTYTDTVVAFAPAMLGCNPRQECNPIRFGSPGFTGYLPFADGWKVVAHYPGAFTLASEVAIEVEDGAPTTGRLTRAALAGVRVVPNPYIVQSQFDRVQFGEGQARLYFTGVPQEGTLRIYSISGQFLQQLQWTPADLNGTGDLQYDLLTREGTELATGLYLYVITPGGTNRGSPAVRGKFVVIR